MKRLFDLMLAVLTIPLWGPVVAIIAASIWLFDGAPVFFRQQRVGQHGRLFRIWKFRTMVTDAEKLGSSLTVGADPRVTKIGVLLRKTKLDELPQLINVLLGEMSFVGPRPEVPTYVDMYTPEQRRVLDLKPGITDMASIKYRDESEQLASAGDPETIYVNSIMPDKIRLNLDYAAIASPWQDLLVIFKTFARIVRSA